MQPALFRLSSARIKLAWGKPMKIVACALTVIALCTLAACGGDTVTYTDPVGTQQGTLKGIWTEDEGIAHFKGVPFAAPPVGNLRWRPPAQTVSWEGTRNSDSFGPQCMQDYNGGNAAFIDNLVKGMGHSWFTLQTVRLFMALTPAPNSDEDCLYLNIRTGNLTGNEKQPVMVWIHGGGHQNGSGADDFYQSNLLVKKGVVLVTINYRLGLFGYFAHPALSADDPRQVSGNYGLLDQVAALQWVQDNIAAFGGDPDNVTIFGESAGSQSVTELMATPLSEGLFHKAIGQSGSSTNSFLFLKDSFDDQLSAEKAGLKFSTAVGAETAEELRAIPATKLIEYAHKGTEGLTHLLPVVDGVVLPKVIGVAFAEGDVPDIPVMVGYNADEGTLLYPLIGSPTPYDFSQRLETPESARPVLTKHYGQDADEVVEIYNLDDAETFLTGSSDMLGDDLFGVNMRYVAMKMENHGAPAYLYFFTRVPPSPTQTAGAFHAAEIPFVFGTHNDLFVAKDVDWELTDKVSSYWTNFARTGNPNGDGLPDWPQYTRANDTWLNINHDLQVEPVSRAQKLDLLERTLVRKIEEAGSALPKNQHVSVPN